TRPGIVVRNGIDNLFCAQAARPKRAAKTFKIIHFGNFYQGQDPTIFLKGFRRFAHELNSDQVRVEIIGFKNRASDLVKDTFVRYLGDFVRFVPYMPKQQLASYCQNQAALFFFPGFREDNGQFCVKVYDYVSMGRNVIVSPGEGDMGAFVKEVGAGLVTNDELEIAQYLHDCYDQWRQTGSVAWNVDEKKCIQFTRREQVRVLAEEVRSFLRSQARF